MEEIEEMYTIHGRVTYSEGKLKEKVVSTTFSETSEKKAHQAFEEFCKEMRKEKHVKSMDLNFHKGKPTPEEVAETEK